MIWEHSERVYPLGERKLRRKRQGLKMDSLDKHWERFEMEMDGVPAQQVVKEGWKVTRASQVGWVKNGHSGH
jgi:hypothetical protein